MDAGRQPLPSDRLFHLRDCRGDRKRRACARDQAVVGRAHRANCSRGSSTTTIRRTCGEVRDERASRGAEIDRGARSGRCAHRRCSATSTRRTSDSAKAGTSGIDVQRDDLKGAAMLACRIHAKDDLRVEAQDMPAVGAGRSAAEARCRRHLRLGPALLFRGAQRQLRRARAADSRSRGVRRRRRDRRRCHARQGRRQGRRQPVACVRPLRLLPGGSRAAMRQHAVPRQRQPVSACPGHVPRIFRHGRAAVLPGRRRRVARRARLRRAACRRTACGQPRRRSARQVGADHRRRHDRLRNRARGAPRRCGEGDGQRHPRSAACAGYASSAPM